MKKTLIIFIAFVLVLFGITVALQVYGEKTKINIAEQIKAVKARDQVLTAMQLYYLNNNKSLPRSISDLQTNIPGESQQYIQLDTRDLSFLEYKYKGEQEAEVCLTVPVDNIKTSLYGSVCKNFTPPTLNK